MSPTLAITGAAVLTPEGWLPEADILLHGDTIAAIGPAAGATADRRIAAHGGLALPGLIDLHGDAFERHVTPRPGVHFPEDVALAANDASLVAHGITTFFYSITDGFEPGPRSRATCRSLLETVEALRPRMACDARIHIRHERVATDGHDELMGWLRDGRVHLLSLNDHLPPLDDAGSRHRYLAGLRRRVPMDAAAEDAFLAALQDRRDLGTAQFVDLAAAAHEHGVALASHDDRTAEEVEAAHALGIRVAEFPLTAETCRDHRRRGAHVMMGAPNAVRGASHFGALSTRAAVADGLVDVLVSDYHYPSLLRAPFLLAEEGILPLADAWTLVSANPAEAAGLGHKGVLAPGKAADVLVLGAGARGVATDVVATVAGGRVALARG